MKNTFLLSFTLLLFSNFSWGQWTAATMSEAKYAVAPVTFGNKVMFAGGIKDNGGPGTNVVEIYDAGTDTWSTQTMSFYAGGNYASTVTEDWAVFGRGVYTLVGKVFVYNNTDGSWETIDMPDPRNDYILASVGNKVMLAGGKIFSQATKRINIYNLETKEWSLDTFPVARTDMRSVTVGEKVFFIGGTSANVTGFSPHVDVYDNSTGNWTTVNLSQGRKNVGLAVVNDKIIVAGGQHTASLVTFSNVVDYIDVNTLEVSSGTLPDDMTLMRSAVVGGQAIFWGSSDPNAYIYDELTGQWTTHTLTPGVSNQAYGTGAVLGDKVYFTGGQQTNPADQKIFIFDAQTQQWSTQQLSSARRDIRAATVANKVLLAGGINFSGAYTSNAVDIFTDVTIIPFSIANTEVLNTGCFGATDGQITVDVAGGNQPYAFSWNPSTVEGSAPSGLGAGTYSVTITDASGHTLTASFEISQPAQLTATTTSTGAHGNLADGAASVIAEGGTPPYEYLWNDGAGTTSPTLENVPAGIYTVIITDSNGCTLSTSVTVEMLTGTSAAFETAVIIAPTLSDGRFTVQFPATYSTLDIRLTDLQGRHLQRWQGVSSGEQLQVNAVVSGTCLLQLTDQAGVQGIKRVVFQKR